MDGPSAISIDHLNPFIEAVLGSFRTLTATATNRTRVATKPGGPDAEGISGVLPVSGDLIGLAVVAFPENVACAAAGRIAGQEFAGVTPQVLERIGELAGVIAGDARNRLSQKGLNAQVGPSRVIAGRSRLAGVPDDATCVSVEFSGDLGRFRLDLALRKVG